MYYNGGTSQFAELNPDAVADCCCIQDCNELNTTNINVAPGFAYTTEPNNVPVVGNYHLAYNSPCVDILHRPIGPKTACQTGHDSIIH